MMASLETNTMREELRLLVDHIPEGDVPVARKILRALMDPVELALLADLRGSRQTRSLPYPSGQLAHHPKGVKAASLSRVGPLDRRQNPIVCPTY
jgi:hypothetical protein